MSLREILKFPDPRLREISVPVTEFNEELKTLVKDMLETMYDAKGIGLAAPQIGVLQRVIVIDTRPRDEKGRRYNYDEMTEMEKAVEQPLVLINPVIVKGEGKTTFDEGCLSIPGYYETVERFDKVVMKAQDVNGKEFTVETDGLLAICMQHELDHLEGTLFVDHLSFLKSKRIKDQIKKRGYPVREEAQETTREKEPV
ncbi:MAG TPA: peptide deformylase [Pseudobdellovibrionaceae bacterium]|nr:peptide deformylase [Pseudobdellovibrionaceae bacterium]